MNKKEVHRALRHTFTIESFSKSQKGILSEETEHFSRSARRVIRISVFIFNGDKYIIV